MSKHTENCKQCKIRIFELLYHIYGHENIFRNYKLDFPSKVERLNQNDFNLNLENIYNKLQNYRGYKDFVKVKKLSPVDFYIKDRFVLEFDESQHFTTPRLLTLENYSENIHLGFSKKKWIELCKQYNRRDNDPPYRDEQRAWYDSLRDFIPIFLNLKPTIRLYASDYIWCSLNVNKKRDIDTFKRILVQNEEL